MSQCVCVPEYGCVMWRAVSDYQTANLSQLPQTSHFLTPPLYLLLYKVTVLYLLFYSGVIHSLHH